MAQDIKIKYIRLKATKCDKERVASIEMSFFFFRCCEQREGIKTQLCKEHKR